MILTYATLFRTETDAHVIATLQRKGWTEAKLDVQPVPADDPRVVDGYPAGYPEQVKPLVMGAIAKHTEMTQSEVVELRAEHAEALAAYIARPQPWRVSKDTLIGRVIAEGRLDDVMTALAAQTPAQQFAFTHSAWFWSNNETLRGLCADLEMDADVILARDEFLM